MLWQIKKRMKNVNILLKHLSKIDAVCGPCFLCITTAELVIPIYPTASAGDKFIVTNYVVNLSNLFR